MIKHLSPGIQQQKFQSGAALLAVLIVALVMVILMSVASQNMQEKLLLAENSKQQLQDHAAVQAKMAELSYLLTTQRVTVAGISQGINQQGLMKDSDGHWIVPILGDEIRTDSYIYETDDFVKYSIQNDAGLIAINTREQFWLKRWLQGYGFSRIEQAQMADTLADYADPDEWRRPVGAEKASYTNLGLSSPANFLLQNCNELQRIIKWREVAEAHSGILNQCSLGRVGLLNLNSIPPKLWQILWPNSAESMMEHRRNNKWFITTSDALTIEPALLSISDELFATMGGSGFTVNVQRGGVQLATNIRLGTGKSAPLTARKSQFYNRSQ